MGSCVVLTMRSVVVVVSHRLMGSCVVLTVSGVAIFTMLVLSRGNSDNCAKDEGSHIFKFDFLVNIIILVFLIYLNH